MKLKFPLSLAAFCLSSMACFSFAAEKVNTVPPALYTKEIASVVTPLEVVLTNLPDPPKGADDGWVLLDEVIHHVLPDGRRVLVEHQVYKALSDAGASNLGRSVRGFHTSRQKFSVVMARTIQPDGKKQNAQPDAMFLQTPQREADQSLYQDNSESVIVFPNVKLGSITESITVIEDIKPRIPGQFTSYVGMSLGWHAHTMRCLVELPKDFAERLIISPLGSGVPEPMRETLKNGRVRIEWMRHDTPMMHGEPGRAPFSQTGPLARLTTLRDWSELLRWYVPLAQRQANLGANLESLVDEWTKDAKSPREVLAILTAKVSDDVRYVGLEFGDSDLEPHAAASVWEQQYGDCKDKASLLCAMLLRKGITAHMALLNTRHLGRIEHRSPDYRDFDHVIVRAELPDGAVFCDPTISGAPPGTLSPDDSDRDLLLVKEPEQWVHTPPQEPGRVAVNFNAKLATTGELSGWVTLEADGYFGTAYGDLETKGTRQQLLQRLSNRVDSLYPGARVVDVKTMPRDKNGTYHVEAYFVVPPSGALTLAFPFDAAYLPETGDAEKRETDLYLWRNQLETSWVIALPAGYHALLPQPLKVSSPFCEIDARWEKSDTGLKAVCKLRLKVSRVRADDFKIFAQNIATARAWFSKSLKIEAGVSVVLSPPPEDDLGDFPQLPTGEGQLSLLDERFPVDGNHRLRHLALEKMLEMFSNDTVTKFQVQAQLAYVDTLDGAHDRAIERIRVTAAPLRGSVTAENAAVADYILAIALKNKGNDDDALALLDKMAPDVHLSVFRRSWVQHQRGLILAKKDPKKAIEAVRAGIALEAGDEAMLFRQFAQLALANGGADDFAGALSVYLQKSPRQAGEVMMALASLARKLPTKNPEQASALLKILQKAGDAPNFGIEFENELSQARVASESQAAYVGIRERISKWIGLHPDDVRKDLIPGTLNSQEDFEALIEKLIGRENDSQNAAQIRSLALESLMRFEPGEWCGQRLWRALLYTDFMERESGKTEPSSLMAELYELAETLPSGNDWRCEARFLQANDFTRRGRHDEAAVILLAFAEDKALKEYFVPAAIERFTDNCIERRDHERALRELRRMAAYPLDSRTPVQALKGCLLALELGRTEDAHWFFDLMSGLKKSVVEKSHAAEQIMEMLKHTPDWKSFEAWHLQSAKWWPAWEKFEQSHGETPGVQVAYIPSIHELGLEIGTHLKNHKLKDGFRSLSILAHAARTCPESLFELVEFLGIPSQFSQLEKDNGAERRRLIIAISDAGPVPDARLQWHIKFWAIVSLLDLNVPFRPLLLAKELKQTIDIPDGRRSALARLYILAAIRSKMDVANAAKNMEAILTEEADASERARNVSMLADCYRELKRPADEKALLERELKDEKRLGTQDVVKNLKERLDALLETTNNGDGPAIAARAWLAAGKPEWFDYARPKDLQDPRFRDLDAALNGGSGILPMEAAKLCILVAQDGNQPQERRDNALIKLAWLTATLSRDMPEARAWITTLTEEKSLPRRLHASCLLSFLHSSFRLDLPQAIAAVSANPLCEAIDKEDQPSLTVIRRYGALAPSDLDGAHALATALLTERQSFFSIEVVERLIRRLVDGGRIADARSHLQEIGRATFDESIAREKQARQLSAMKIVSAAENYAPVHEAVLAVYLKHRPLGDLSTAPPNPFRLNATINLPEDKATLLRERWIKEGSWPRQNFSFWGDLLSDVPHDASYHDMAFAILEAALAKAPGDDERAMILSGSLGLVDIDDAGVRTKMDALLKPWRNSASEPLSAEAVQIVEVIMKLRTGAPVDAASVLRKLKNPFSVHVIQRTALRSALAHRDKDAAKNLLNVIDINSLFDTYSIGDAVAVWRMLGMKDETALGEERLREEIYTASMTAWMDPTIIDPSLVIDLADKIAAPELVSDSFSKAMAAALNRGRRHLFFVGNEALLRHNWEQALKSGDDGIRQWPTFYTFEFFRGKALFNLGRKPEAVKALEAYTLRCNDEPSFAEATELLAKLKQN